MGERGKNEGKKGSREKGQGSQGKELIPRLYHVVKFE
jgi:hypothetical protein